MNGELPVFYCKHCGQELQPYWLEGYEGVVRYEEVGCRPYKEYKVYYKCPSEKWYSFKDEHSFIIHTIKKLAEFKENRHLDSRLIRFYRRDGSLIGGTR